jgi:hypothetical protein
MLIGNLRIDAANHVQVERALGDRGAFDPDAVEGGVLKRVEDYSCVIVESVDRLCSDLLQAYYCNRR